MVNKEDLEIRWNELDKYICKCVYIETKDEKDFVILRSYQNYKDDKIIQVASVTGKITEVAWTGAKLYDIIDNEKCFTVTGDELFEPKEQPPVEDIPKHEESKPSHSNRIINGLNLLSYAELVELAFGENKLNIDEYNLGNKSQIIDIILEYRSDEEINLYLPAVLI